MLQLHEDPNFHYEAIRAIGTARYGGADISEILSILPNIKPGDFEDWFNEWNSLGERVLSTIDESRVETYSPATLRDVYFRASRYFFTADFFLHGNPADPRIDETFQRYRDCFDKANAMLPNPGVSAMVQTSHGFDIPIIVYRAAEASASQPRPTLLIGGGFDSNMEETLHDFGFAALERGYNVVLYEGPGQPRVLHLQKKGFVHDWEKVVTPIMDYIEAHRNDTLSFVDSSRTGLIGMSLGGYLAARAAAFEPRLAAVICLDGVFDFMQPFRSGMSECVAAFEAGEHEKLEKLFAESSLPTSTTGRRWMHDHGSYAFQTKTALEFFSKIPAWKLAGIAEKIKMPAFIGLAEEDLFFKGQPERLAEAIGPDAKLFRFGSDQAAQLHCASGALIYQNQAIYEWFASVVHVGKK